MTALASDLGIAAGTWNIDPAHSEVSFKIRHLMSKVRGHFDDFHGSVVVADKIADSTATAEIKVASVDTRNGDRDNHIRSNDILGSEEFPVMAFATTGVRAEDGEYFVDGTLTIKGLTKPVTLAVEFNGIGQDPWGGTRAGFTATTSISRKEYGIEFNVPLQGDKALLGDKVEILLEIQAVHAG